jgi:putative transposase
MANTYTQIHIHFVFAVKHRHGLIHKSWQTEMHKYLNGIVTQKGHTLLALNSMPDQVHILLGFRPTEAISSFMKDLKAHSSKWINANRYVHGKFEWQSGYGAFSMSRNQIERVRTYIANQEKHHRQKSFTAEYRNLLQENNITFDPSYTFKMPE